jgi:hypothetical protein
MEFRLAGILVGARVPARRCRVCRVWVRVAGVVSPGLASFTEVKFKY